MIPTAANFQKLMGINGVGTAGAAPTVIPTRDLNHCLWVLCSQALVGTGGAIWRDEAGCRGVKLACSDVAVLA